MKKRIWRGLLLLVVLVTAGALFFRWQQESIVTEIYRVRSADLPASFDGMRIVHLSDLHGKEFGENSERLLKKVAALEPDLIAITGDLIDQENQLAMVPTLARGLAAVAPTYYVTGNHEWAVRRVGDLKGILSQCGVTVLTNEYITLEREGATLAVAGVDDPNGPADQKTPQELKAEIDAELGDVYTVLLSHRDSVFDYAGWGYGLTLCGHGHGGIIRIPIMDRGLLGTDRQFFPEFDGGLYGFADGGACVVSRGLGSNTVPFRAFRLFNRPDLPLIILNTSEEVS